MFLHLYCVSCLHHIGNNFKSNNNKDITVLADVEELFDNEHRIYAFYKIT